MVKTAKFNNELRRYSWAPCLSKEFMNFKVGRVTLIWKLTTGTFLMPCGIWKSLIVINNKKNLNLGGHEIANLRRVGGK